MYQHNLGLNELIIYRLIVMQLFPTRPHIRSTPVFQASWKVSLPYIVAAYLQGMRLGMGLAIHDLFLLQWCFHFPVLSNWKTEFWPTWFWTESVVGVVEQNETPSGVCDWNHPYWHPNCPNCELILYDSSLYIMFFKQKI